MRFTCPSTGLVVHGSSSAFWTAAASRSDSRRSAPAALRPSLPARRPTRPCPPCARGRPGAGPRTRLPQSGSSASRRSQRRRSGPDGLTWIGGEQVPEPMKGRRLPSAWSRSLPRGRHAEQLPPPCAVDRSRPARCSAGRQSRARPAHARAGGRCRTPRPSGAPGSLGTGQGCCRRGGGPTRARGRSRAIAAVCEDTPPCAPRHRAAEAIRQEGLGLVVGRWARDAVLAPLRAVGRGSSTVLPSGRRRVRPTSSGDPPDGAAAAPRRIQRLAQVAQDVPAVRDLAGLWGTGAGAVGVGSGPRPSGAISSCGSLGSAASKPATRSCRAS